MDQPGDPAASFWIGRNTGSSRLPYLLRQFAETPKLAQDWAYRWLAACAKADRERYQIPLLEERALGDPTLIAEPLSGALILDAAERRALLVREAAAGTRSLAAGAWTVA
ncbi:MAG: hypothetical protein HYU87_09025 [Chloroflexi bacterium]|nr:hypothetical protein [Chloroflexota bacterium]